MRGRSGFTLVEIIVSGVILALLSAACLTGMRSLTASEDFTRNRVLAVNLLQKSLEEVRKAAPVYFDSLGRGGCTFVPGNNCGFAEDLGDEFPGFTRSLDVQAESGMDFKRVTVTVGWEEKGKNKSLSSVLLLARPPEPMPGNLIGMVRKTSGGTLGGVSIALSYVGEDSRGSSAGSNWSAWTGDDGQRTNYDFSRGEGMFNLRPGVWRLRAARSHANTVTIDNIVINPFEETRIDIEMNYNPPPPKPKPNPKPNPKPEPKPEPKPKPPPVGM